MEETIQPELSMIVFMTLLSRLVLDFFSEYLIEKLFVLYFQAINISLLTIDSHIASGKRGAYRLPNDSHRQVGYLHL